MTCPFDLENKKEIVEFDEKDPYNPKNTLKGYVNRRQGQLYGALYITHVNNIECPQVIYSAPKQHYPFDKDDKWTFPDYDEVELYEKLDGTCIISYVYKNKEGKRFLTFKTRLRPFLGFGKYGNFFELWNEIISDRSWLTDVCFNENWNYIFELYGKRNKILIDYDIPLDAKLTFGVDAKSGDIYPPSFFEIQIPKLHKREYDIKELKVDYIDWQQKLEDALEIDEENEILKGEEGLVWYFLKGGVAKQIKCKPPTVLKYHWSSDVIAYESIYTTIINAFENFDSPSYDDVAQLLQEEFDLNKIEKSKIRIKKILSRVTFNKKLQYKLAGDYKKLGVDINEDKVTVMRWFGSNYPKSEAKIIYNLLKQYEDTSSI